MDTCTGKFDDASDRASVCPTHVEFCRSPLDPVELYSRDDPMVSSDHPSNCSLKWGPTQQLVEKMCQEGTHWTIR